MYQPNPGPESRFTWPRDDCPHPEYWTSDDDDSTEHEVTWLVAAFVIALQPERVLETGTAWGQTAAMIAGALKTNGHGRLISLEPSLERVTYSTDRCRAVLEGDTEWFDILPISSMDWEPGPGSIKFDFCWFDSLFELRAAEFRKFHPWMSSRCVVGFHDTGPHHPLKPDIDQLEREGLIAPMHLPTPRGVTFARVLFP